MRLPLLLRPFKEIRLKTAEDPLDILVPDPFPCKSLGESLVVLFQPTIQRLLRELPGSGDIGHGHSGPELDQHMVVRWQSLQGAMKGHEDPPALGRDLAVLRLLVRAGIGAGLGLKRLVAHKVPAGAWWQLGPKIGQLHLRRPDSLVDPEQLACLVEAVPLADQELLQPDG